MEIQDAVNRLYYDQTLSELRLMNSNTLYPNISYNSLLYMDLIAYTPACTVSYIAKRLGISKPAVTLKVNELVKQGLVTKTQSEKDKRVHHLHLAHDVAAEYRTYDEYLNYAVDALKERYSPQELDTFCDMLELIRVKYLEKDGQT